MGQKSILIVDDDAHVRNILERTLAAAGYSVLKAQNGKEGVAVARDKKPALILMDIDMPDMCGDVAKEALMDDPDTKDIPVVFLTGIVSEKEAGKPAIGGNIFIAKPIDAPKLLQKIRELLA
jgi:CheY-like chemotaxis protein